MRITLMHNPKAGDAEHGRKQLMAALAEAGHEATYQSTKKSDYKKALKKPADLVLAAGGDGTVVKVGRRLIDTGIPMRSTPGDGQ
jgi:Sphingosine kinase and enzymes related to eukaryotic diacylglycerol kinase